MSYKEEAAKSLAQSYRWIIAGSAGAYISTTSVLTEGVAYTFAALVPLILSFTALDFAIRVMIESNIESE